MRRTDPRGIEVTSPSASAAAALEGAVLSVAGHREDAAARVDAALADDPGLVRALVLRGLGCALQARPAPWADAVEMRKRAIGALAERGGTEAEVLLVRALGAWVDGQQADAVALFAQVAEDTPGDLQAVKAHHATAFFLGMSDAMARTSSRVVRSWDRAMPGYGLVLGCHAFALEEVARYAEAEAVGRQAVEADPTDIWAGHAVAHVMDMQGRLDEGVAWLEALRPHHARCDNMRLHNDWHQALLQLERGESEVVLALYDERLRAGARRRLPRPHRHGRAAASPRARRRRRRRPLGGAGGLRRDAI